MKNFLYSGEVVPVTGSTSGTASGDVVVTGSLVGIAISSAGPSETVAISTEGVFAIPKAAATTFAQGAKVGYNTSTKLAVPGGTSGSYLIGLAQAAAGNGPVVVPVAINVVPSIHST